MCCLQSPVGFRLPGPARIILSKKRALRNVFCIRQVLRRNLEIRLFQLCANELAAHLQRYMAFAADSGKRTENHIAIGCPELHGAFDDVELQRANMPFVVVVARVLELQSITKIMYPMNTAQMTMMIASGQAFGWSSNGFLLTSHTPDDNRAVIRFVDNQRHHQPADSAR